MGEALSWGESRARHGRDVELGGRVGSLDDVPEGEWRQLASVAAEPNVFFDPGFAKHVRFCDDGLPTRALLARAGGRLIGLLPVTSGWKSLHLPLPILVAGQAHTMLGTPLLDARCIGAGAKGLLHAAADRHTQLLVIKFADLEGPVVAALSAAAAELGLPVTIGGRHARAALAVPKDPTAYFEAVLSKARLKNQRRVRNHLAEHGAVSLRLSRLPDEVAAAMARFMALETAGWKGRRGTALAARRGDAKFGPAMAASLAQAGAIEIVELLVGERPVASGLVLYHARHAYYFKIAFDEEFARHSPGVQLTMALTTHLAEAGRADFVDSAAHANHPMIDALWRERRRIGDLYISLGAAGPALTDLVFARNAVRSELKRLFYFVQNQLRPQP